MGKVFEYLNNHKYHSLDLVIALMTEPDSDLRITDLDVLRKLFIAPLNHRFTTLLTRRNTLNVSKNS